jgi:adenylate kinase
MIIFMGLAGSGKSTLGQLLAAHLHCPWVSTGNLLRQKMDKATQEEMLQGKIISDKQTLAVLDEEFERIGASQNEFVLDGSPRTMPQAKWLVEKIKAGQLKLTAVIHLNVPKELARERLLSRGRPDDTPPAIAERFEEYDIVIMQVLNYLKTQGYAIHEIDADHQPEVTEANILKVLGVNHAP